jgi:cell cycle arrest protein BUB3
VVNIWDGNNKKRLCQIPGYPTSIAALAFSREGRYLAIASSYTWEFGEKEHPLDAIYVRAINDLEVRPKPRVSS